MASNHTPNYSLSQWEGGDQFSRLDFNEDNAKLDAALKGLTDGKASASSVSSLASRVASLEGGITQKADKSTVSSVQSSMLRIAMGQYTGNGLYESGNPRVLDFSSSLGRPAKLLVVRQRDAEGEILLLLYGCTSSMWSLSGSSGSRGMNTVTWSGNKVSWHAPESGSMLNKDGVVYLYFAIG